MKRYNLKYDSHKRDGIMTEDDDGEWVLYKDVKQLEAELIKIKNELTEEQLLKLNI